MRSRRRAQNGVSAHHLGQTPGVPPGEEDHRGVVERGRPRRRPRRRPDDGAGAPAPPRRAARSARRPSRPTCRTTASPSCAAAAGETSTGPATSVEEPPVDRRRATARTRPRPSKRPGAHRASRSPSRTPGSTRSAISSLAVIGDPEPPGHLERGARQHEDAVLAQARAERLVVGIGRPHQDVERALGLDQLVALLAERGHEQVAPALQARRCRGRSPRARGSRAAAAPPGTPTRP